VTKLGVASFAPYFFPDGKRIIFASNLKDPHGRNFDLFAINADGTGLEQITYNDSFDGFPMFSPNGKKLVFASNRNAKAPRETNVFMADWMD
jgi:TolB protein